MGGGSSKEKKPLDNNQMDLIKSVLTSAPRVTTNSSGVPADEYNYILEN